MSIKADFSQAKRAEKLLGDYANKAVPIAIKDSLNTMAFRTMNIGRANITKNMVVREPYVLRSVQVVKATRSNLQARVGSTLDALEVQELGGSVSGKKGNKAIPTATASGEGDTAYPRRRRVRPSNRMNKLKLNHRSIKGSRRQRNFLAVKQAAANGDRYVFLDLGRSKGIFRVMGGKKKPRVKMIHNLSKKTVRVPRNPWLEPATKEALAFGVPAYVKSLERSFDNLKRANRL